MRLADKYMLESLERLYKEGSKDKNPRPIWRDVYPKSEYILEGTTLTNKDTNNCIELREVRKISEDAENYIVETPAYTYSLNGQVHRYDISKGEFPITTLRQIYIKKAIGEILWIYQDASNDLNVLKDKYGVSWWDSWDIGDRTIGCCYGETVRRHNLLNNLLDGIKKDPYGRRHIMNMWQEEDFKNPHGLKPCCYQTQFIVREDKYIDMILYQRSSDYIVSGNINEMQYVALLMMVAKHCGYEAGEFIHMMGNQHIYDRHIEQAKEMITRTPLDCDVKLVLDTDKINFYDFTVDDFKLEGYVYVQPQMVFPVAI